ncbi:MAG: hypothetical protein ACTSW7_00730 [Candidatus Thorarchaeota archaeon]|nr:hypothetical protein [Thermoplasmatales archaeon]
MTKKTTSTKRIDYLSDIGQAIVTGMRAETLAAIAKDKGHPSYCLTELFRLANIPLDFQVRWSSERAILDVLIKARDYGFVDKHCGGRWVYTGPEVKAAEKARDKKRTEVKTKIVIYFKSRGLVIDRDSINVESYGKNKGKTTVIVTVPKDLWIK